MFQNLLTFFPTFVVSLWSQWLFHWCGFFWCESLALVYSGFRQLSLLLDHLPPLPSAGSFTMLDWIIIQKSWVFSQSNHSLNFQPTFGYSLLCCRQFCHWFFWLFSVPSTTEFDWQLLLLLKVVAALEAAWELWLGPFSLLLFNSVPIVCLSLVSFISQLQPPMALKQSTTMQFRKTSCK